VWFVYDKIYEFLPFIFILTLNGGVFFRRLRVVGRLLFLSAVEKQNYI
jgi:hypothetical protein